MREFHLNLAFPAVSPARKDVEYQLRAINDFDVRHLGNGARLERINFLADRSEAAMRQSHGTMVNYLYKLDDIEANHEAFVERAEVAAAPSVKRLLRSGRPARQPEPGRQDERSDERETTP